MCTTCDSSYRQVKKYNYIARRGYDGTFSILLKPLVFIFTKNYYIPIIDNRPLPVVIVCVCVYKNSTTDWS